ncbi:hypothetical protein F5Y13DRAFT_106702 [Hypoxylon sp. FL1857]|nr:hypothetical protein F5Y13DRAFT_106702 [Hypoxylon sp. FL1857]
MSFGWSAGDVAAAAKLLWDLYRALNDADGAPEHYRKSAATLRSIRFRLRTLGKVIGEDQNPDPLTETEEASLLEKADKDDIRSVVVNLKHAFGKLEALVDKGCDMRLDPGSRRRRRDWPMHQINKLRWYIGKEDEVDNLIQHMNELTASLPDLYQKLNSELLKQLATTQGVYHETDIKWLKAIFNELKLVKRIVAQGQLAHMDEHEKEEGPPLLHAGPDLGVPPAPTGPGLDRGSALSHLEGIAHEIMSTSLSTRVKGLCVDHHLKRKLTEWFTGKTANGETPAQPIPPRLWLYGDQAGTISATVYTAALDRRRPAIAFAGRHSAGGQLLSAQERLFRMVYSLLFQLLQQLEDLSVFVVPGVDKPFTDLDVSMQSMPLALEYLSYFLSILPECICIVDGWNFIANDAEPAVKEVLRSFLDIFEKAPQPVDDLGSRTRLLLTSRGNSQMLQGLGKEFVDRFDSRNHVGNSGQKLYTALLGIDW